MMGLMQDIPDPIRLTRFLIDSPEESPVGLSGPNFVNLGNINGSDDPGSIMPLAMSTTGMTTQLETGQVSVETSSPNPLTKFINIYSDEESPEASHETHVRVQEEKGLEKIPSPDPEVQT
jgi:hypothetical protein